MGMRKGRGPGRRAAPRSPALVAPDTTPSGTFRVPFRLVLARAGKVVSVDRTGNPLAQAELVTVEIRTPKDLQEVANDLGLGRVVCTPYSFTMQVANGIAASAFALVQDEPAPQAAEETQTQVGGEQREGQDRVEGKDEKADAGGNGAAGPEGGDGGDGAGA